MAMPPGNVVLSDKMQFPTGAVAGGDPRQWYPDERDGFIAWIRSEFAASNAIIDSLCHHLRAVGEPGEYDFVIGYVQQRRGSWNPVLHMQQYLPITEIILALQQVAWRKQQSFADQFKPGGKEFKRSGLGSRSGQRFEMPKENRSSSVDTQNHSDANPSLGGNWEKRVTGSDRTDGKLDSEVRRSDDQVHPAKPAADASLKCEVDSSMKSSDGTSQSSTRSLAEEVKDEKIAFEGTADLTVEKNATSIQKHGVEKLDVFPETFSSLEMCDGKMMNVVEGLNLYNKLLDEAEVSNLISLVNDLKAAGRCGQFRGPTYVVSKRPNRGHGRETIQLGVAISDGPPDVNEKRVERIPGLIQDVIDRLVSIQVMPSAPDSCIIDIFNEGDHSQPHAWPHWFGRPICMLGLTECDMVFGRAIAMDRPGSYSGAFRLNLSSGSLIAMQGKSADYTKRAIPSIRKQRVLVTLTKSVPIRTPLQCDASRFHHATTSPPQSSNWGQPPIRSPNHIRPKHYAPSSTTGVLSMRPQILPQLVPPAQSSMPPLFVPPVPTAMAFASPMPMPVPIPPGTTSWPTPAPRHAPPRVLAPGTGVFLPPTGSGDNSSPPLEISLATGTEVGGADVASDTGGSTVGTGSNWGKVNGNVENPREEEKSLVKLEQLQDCNGTGGGGVVVATMEEKEIVDSTSSDPRACLLERDV